MDNKQASTRLDAWIEERHQDIVGTRFRVTKTLFSGVSPYQSVDVIETAGFGRMLLNDGLAMISERDEFVYHEMIAHVPLFAHANPEHVLVIGGGDGGTVREVLRHDSVKQCRLVEIDEMVLDACKEFIPLTAACLSDERVDVRVTDAVEYVATTDDTYDVILVDSTDPIGPAAPLFGETFYRNVAARLRPGGIVVSQAESPFYEGETQRRLIELLHGIFKRRYLYNYSNLTYPGGLWSFSFMSNDVGPLQHFSSDRVVESGLQFKYYNAELQRAAFAIPTFMKENLGEYLTEITED